MASTTEARTTYPDGRLIPIAGDTVYQTARGPFDLESHIEGTVYRRGQFLRVRITRVMSFFGNETPHKTYALNLSWTVLNDPEIARRREAKNQAERERREDEDRERAIGMEEARRSYDAALADGHSPLTIDSVRVGDIVTGHHGTYGFVRTRIEVAEVLPDKGWVFGWHIDDDGTCDRNQAPGSLGRLNDYTVEPR